MVIIFVLVTVLNLLYFYRASLALNRLSEGKVFCRVCTIDGKSHRGWITRIEYYNYCNNVMTNKPLVLNKGKEEVVNLQDIYTITVYKSLFKVVVLGG